MANARNFRDPSTGRPNDRSIGRRTLLTSLLEAGAASAVLGLGWGAVTMRDVHAHWVPRPPGALAGRDFLSACARCGLCVGACPYETLKLSGFGDPAPIGTPFFEPEKVPCYMCPDIPCVKVCPTGALSPDFTDIREAKMGVAVIDPNACLSWQGLRCEVCFRDCPASGEAITIAPHPRGLSKHTVFVPQIRPDRCTGCGLCTKSCPTEKPAVHVADPQTVLGEIGRHYRLGWLEDDDPKNVRSADPAQPNAAEGAPSGDGGQTAAPEVGLPFGAGLDYLNQEVLP